MHGPFGMPNSVVGQSQDGHGCADHDQPYDFGVRVDTAHPGLFSTREYCRLLIMRSRLHARDALSELRLRRGRPTVEPKPHTIPDAPAD